jgi:rifampin ADP-ribosylating transferase
VRPHRSTPASSGSRTIEETRMSEPESASTSHSDGARRFYHGTRAHLRPGDLVRPGHGSNYTERTSSWVYFSETLEAATWGAELAKGDGPGRIYIVEPTGSFVDDPNLTDRKFPGNPTRSYRSREPLRVVRELLEWQGHAPEVIQAMKDGIAGLEPIDD